jgi:epoxide hydrolase-like predicted phosphatase
MMSGLVPNSSPMVAVVLAARARGIRTALLSNSWGLDYDRTGWAELFDAVVISGEVGLRKPEPAIYRLAAERLGVAPEGCVFVDDLAPNVRGAAAVGMVGVHYVDHVRAVGELEELFGVPLMAPKD